MATSHWVQKKEKQKKMLRVEAEPWCLSKMDKYFYLPCVFGLACDVLWKLCVTFPINLLSLSKQRKDPTRARSKESTVEQLRPERTVEKNLKRFSFHRTLRVYNKCKGPLENTRLPAAFCLGTSTQPSQGRYTGS